ncbi:mechanosensitive ion channel protein 3, chloroplastic isoform X2 [Elaeis guineensis]|uniref:Mechanosensitive ion channel protein 3, chloroplastic isoform X2 n=1 Tax=Elaeis guineensis var. tenera TaxID=51953 RepID=A0A6I9S8L9_ELAGV|nr:mechanosensitive ion channel protein 3, chloroplastic isoform X2 [Elaeis guineensis]
MAVGASPQLFHEFGVFKRFGQANQFKSSEMKSWHHLPSFSFSSCASRQDVWSLHVSDRINKPVLLIPYRYNVFISRSFAVPSSVREIPLLKSTSLALRRSYDALLASPLTLQLVPAVGIIAFAVWGLGPFMRSIRSLFHNDNNWKKSKTYHVSTSYIQPLLLWAGATLICRALDPVVLPSEASQAVKQRLLSFVRSLSTVLAFAYCLSSLIQQTQKFFMETSGFDGTRNMGFEFAGKAVYTAVWVAAFSLFMELLGFSTQKWITAGGLGTVLLTLAGREIFTNFLSSIMIHATRPFVVNEWIQTKIEGYEVSGTVEHVGWWSPTIIRGDDREAVHIPNHKFTVNVVRNLSQKTHWRIKTHLAISHLDISKINNIVADMRKVLAKNSQIEQQRLHRRVFLENINPENQALLILISCFVKTSHFEEYLCVKEAVLLDLLRVISHHRARLATPIRTVQKIYGDADMENIPYSETILTRSATAANRPFLLIEPSPRINGDDKAKPRGSRTNEEQNSKATAASGPRATSSSEGAILNNSDKQLQKKKNSGDSRSKSNKADPATAPSLNSQLESLDSVGSTSKSGENPLSSEAVTEQVDGTSPVHAKNEGEKVPTTTSPVARPAFEDNIVLGVALGGSKQTLPIEEGMGSVASSSEANELDKKGSLSSTKDRKEQIPAVSSQAKADQRDQER